MTIQQLVESSLSNIVSYFNEYELTHNSLLTDIKRVILHCSLKQLISEFKANESLLLIDLQWDCDPTIAVIVGDDKCQKSLTYMVNNLRKIFKKRFIKLNSLPDGEIPGEVIEASNISKSFNFKALKLFLDKNSLSGLKRDVKENLSVKQKIYNNFA